MLRSMLISILSVTIQVLSKVRSNYYERWKLIFYYLTVEILINATIIVVPRSAVNFVNIINDNTYYNRSRIFFFFFHQKIRNSPKFIFIFNGKITDSSSCRYFRVFQFYNEISWLAGNMRVRLRHSRIQRMFVDLMELNVLLVVWKIHEESE